MTKVKGKNKNTQKNTQNAPEEKKDKRGDVSRIAGTMWKPGQSGNPNGRPVGKRNKDTMFELALEGYARKLLANYNKSHKKQIAWEDFDGDPELDIFMQLVDKARNGDLKAIEAFLEHRHGKATQPIEVNNPIDDPLVQARIREIDAEIESWERQWEKLDYGNKNTHTRTKGDH